MKTLPYSNVFVDLLTAIHNALGYCHEKYTRQEPLLETDENLSQIFEKALKLSTYRTSGLDTHIVKGLTLSKNKRKEKNIYPRLTKLVIYHYLNTQEKNGSNRGTSSIIPSPLQILYHALTVPNEPQTAAYAFVLCRDMLFYYLKLHPKHPDLSDKSANFEEFGEEEIFNSISSFKSHVSIYARWPGVKNNSYISRTNYLSGHILSLKGYAYLWFKTDQELLAFCKPKKDSYSLQDRYNSLVSQNDRYGFRLSAVFSELPDTSEINNWIFGTPIPLRGADILFYGGLKKTFSAGLVISLHGQPGTGKTSAALSLAATMSPFNTKTLYLSLEEDPEDLRIRLNSLIPDYLRKMSIYSRKELKNNTDWFRALKFTEDLNISDLTDILIELKSRIDKNDPTIHTKDDVISLPATCPLILVIDNINELFEKEKILYKDIERFIEECRNMGAFVILIAAEDIPVKYRIDYLVDVAIHLKQEGIDTKYEKPVRVMQLLKTRHQVSRQGTHVFHISNSKGFRISPQVPSQMDRKEKIKIELPSKKEFIHTLNIQGNGNKFEYIPLLSIAAKSQILIHGNGSSGKAGFALKLLLTPLIEHEKIIKGGASIKNPHKFIIQTKYSEQIKLKEQKKNKVLIISFLYPEEYYEELQSRLDKQFSQVFSNFEKHKTSITVKAFYPGYLTPEDFVYKIVRFLEEAKLEGDPYTGVLLDGLHNVFLQFKNLQDAHMIWPLLYSILYRYSVTVITTFTNFAVNENGGSHTSASGQTPQDFMLMQQGQKPFLHGLVKASDYFFVLEENLENSQRTYLLSVKGSIRELPPTEKLKWDRESLSLTKA